MSEYPMVRSENIIKKVVLEVETDSMETALKLKDEFSAFFNEKITGFLENYFDNLSWANPKDIIKLDEIDIQIDVNSEQIFNEIEAQIKQKFDLKFEELLNRNMVQIETENSEKNIEEKLLYFVNNGYAPWWSNEGDFLSEKQLQIFYSSPNFKKFTQKIISRSNTLSRLILNTDNKLLTSFLLKFLDKTKSPILREFEEFSPKNDRQTRLLFWAPLFEAALTKSSEQYTQNFYNFVKHLLQQKSDVAGLTPTHVKSLLKFLNLSNKLFEFKFELSASKNQKDTLDFRKATSTSEAIQQNKKMLSNQVEEKQFSISFDELPIQESQTELLELDSENIPKEIEKDGILIQNAGLIILHPFLLKFFENQELLSKKAIKEDKKDLALHLLHYIACKTENPSEHLLVMEKFLCNIPLDYPVNRFLKLTKAQKTACEELLAAVLQHWKALKTQNNDILRSEFLTRAGKLKCELDKNILYIERKTQDLLLEKIPWTIGVVKIPWQENITYVEW